MWHNKIDFAAKTCPDALPGDPGQNRENPTGELKTGNRRFKMHAAQRFFLLRGSFPSISMRLQKRFGISIDETLRLALAKYVDSFKGSTAASTFGSRRWSPPLAAREARGPGEPVRPGYGFTSALCQQGPCHSQAV